MNEIDSLPSLAQDLVRIHKIITRGLTIGLTKGEEFIKEGMPTHNLLQGYQDFIHSLVSTLGVHHVSEDDIVFPALEEKLPEAPYYRLFADHREIEATLIPLKNPPLELVGANIDNGLRVIVDSLTKINAIWKPHIEIEEISFNRNTIDGVMSPDDQAQLSAASAKYSQEHSGPPFLVIPFLIFNLAGEDRAAFTQTIPKVVLEELVPKEWKKKWEPMKSFLLD